MKKIELILDGALATEINNLIDIIVSGKNVCQRLSNLLSMALKLINTVLKAVRVGLLYVSGSVYSFVRLGISNACILCLCFMNVFCSRKTC